MGTMQWISTKPKDRMVPQTYRERTFPFRSYRAGSIGLMLEFGTIDKRFRKYAMFISVEALLSAVHSRVRHVPWARWGPAGTRIFPLEDCIVKPAGPFWIASYAPLVVRDYNSLRARSMEQTKDSMPSIPPNPSLGPPSIKLFGEHWEGGELDTHLPFREIVAGDLSFERVVQVVADREWFVVISDEVRFFIHLHAPEKPIMSPDREMEREPILLPCTM